MNAKVLASMFVTGLVSTSLATAQLAQPNERGVAMGHLHLNVSDMAAAKHFWIDVLGATPVTLGTIEGVKVPGAVVLFKLATPTGGTPESSVDHLGFKVKSLADYSARLRAANVPFDVNKNGVQDMVMGPDRLKVELTEDTTLAVPIAHHHIHFYTPDVPAIQAWYAKTFGAIPGKRASFEAADLPGVNLSFSPTDKLRLPTKGRALDHIGFEITNLEAFCEAMEAEGVKFDVPYRKVSALGIAVAFFTDPWGTYIELTEGLRKL